VLITDFATRPPRAAAVLAEQVARALGVAHRHSVIHRDLKPGNIILAADAQPGVVDFGLALRSGSGDARLSRTGAVTGSPAYMAPEQARGDLDAMGPSCDVYSLGVVLYELLAGRLPFEGDLIALLNQHVERTPEPPSRHRPGLDAVLDAICLKALAK